VKKKALLPNRSFDIPFCRGIGQIMLASTAPLYGPFKAYSCLCPFFRGFGLSALLHFMLACTTDREPGRSTCCPLTGSASHKFAALESLFERVQMAAPFGAGSATPCVFFIFSKIDRFSLNLL
jgi:hypothetical protein